MIQVWRIVHEDYLNSAFTGIGARIAGGRWNSEGFSVVYTAESLSLALLEILVHLEIKKALTFFKAIPITISRKQIQTVSLESLPLTWSELPAGFATRQIGDEWIRSGRSVALRVPSAVVPNEFNCLLNPQHPAFAEMTIGTPIELPVDPRIFRKLK